jgi:undecaprenyl-diphosphatase
MDHALTNDSQARGRVALFRLLAGLRDRFRESSRTLPDGAWRRWLIALAAGFAICMGITWFATWLGERLFDSGALAWETGVIRGLEDDRLLSFHDATWLQAFGSSAMMIPIVVLATGWAAWMQRPVRAAGVVAAFLLAKVVVFSGWAMWERARPDFINDGIGVPAGLGSYPSGHVVQLVAVYGLLFWFWTRASRSWAEQAIAWLLLLILVVATAFARLRVGAHWPSDLVAGAVIGLALLLAVVVAEKFALGGRRAAG